MVNLSGRNQIIADSIKILDNGALIDVMDMLNASPPTSGVPSYQIIELQNKINELNTAMQNKVDGLDIEDLIDEHLTDITLVNLKVDNVSATNNDHVEINDSVKITGVLAVDIIDANQANEVTIQGDLAIVLPLILMRRSKAY